MTPRITTEEWAAELDRIVAETMAPVIPEPRGFTARQFSSRPGARVGICTAQRRIKELIAAGRVRAIGRRPGRGCVIVYEVVTSEQPRRPMSK